MKGVMQIIAVIALVVLVFAIIGVSLFATGINSLLDGNATGIGTMTTGLGLLIAVAFIVAIFAAFGIKLGLGG